MNPRVQPDSSYSNGIPIPASYFEAVDIAQFQAINGDAGGTWQPVTPIVVGGSGIVLAGPSALSSGSTVTTANGNRVVLAANDAVGLQAGHTLATRVIHTSCGGFIDASAGVSPPATYSTTYDGATGKGAGCRFLLPLRVHQGGTFQQAVFTVRLVGGHAGLPVNQPQFRVYAVSELGIVIPLATGFGAGWVQLAIATLGAYNGQTVTLTYTALGGIVVDQGIFGYVAEIVDESGTNQLAGNVYTDVACTFTSIPDLGFS